MYCAVWNLNTQCISDKLSNFTPFCKDSVSISIAGPFLAPIHMNDKLDGYKKSCGASSYYEAGIMLNAMASKLFTVWKILCICCLLFGSVFLLIFSEGAASRFSFFYLREYEVMI